MTVHLQAAPSVLCPLGGVPVIGAACNAVTGGASKAAGSVLGSTVGAAFDAAGQWVAQGAVWLLGALGGAMSSSTTVGLGTKWFSLHESFMAALAAAVVLPMAFVGAIQAIYRQSGAVLVRSFLVNLPLSLLLTGVAVELVRLALSVTDLLSAEVLSAGGVDTRHLLAPVATFLGATGVASPGVPLFVVFVVALVVAVSALVLWMELIVRAAAIAAATLFLPLTLASLVWPTVSHWCRRLAETIAALVLSKFVVAAVLSLAVGAIAGGLGTEGRDGGGFSSVLVGVAMLVIATVSPFSLLKLVPAVEAGAVAHLEGVRHRLASAAKAPVRAANLAMDIAGTAGGASAVGSTAGAGSTTGGGALGDLGGAMNAGEADPQPSGGAGNGAAGPSAGSPGGGGRGGSPVGGGGGSAGAAGVSVGSGDSGSDVGPAEGAPRGPHWERSDDVPEMLRGGGTRLTPGGVSAPGGRVGA
ncbi:MAG TPA: hypothetical protein VMR97_05355 [Acidimicrobiales bacterium]|nr:hypothetical protein [Acidimicrobiales bacterium]